MRRIVRGKIRYISLVPKGANQLPTIFKDADADGNNLNMTLLTKAADTFQETGEIYAAVYVPELRDSQGDIADAKVIKEMMYDYAKHGGTIDIRHNEKPVAKEHAFVAQNFEIQKNDDRFTGMKTYDGRTVDPTGGWGVVIKVDDPDLRAKYRSGEWQGVSMGGHAECRAETSLLGDDLLKSLIDKLAGKSAKDDDMTDEQIAKLVEAQSKAIGEAVAKALKPADPQNSPAPVKKETPAFPAYVGDYSAKSLQEYGFKARKHAIISDVDWAKPESVTKMQTELSVLEKEITDAAEADPMNKENERLAKAAGVTDKMTARERQLTIELYKEKRKSNQGAPGVRTTGETVAKEDEGGEELTDIQLVAIGKGMADYANGKTSAVVVKKAE